MNGTRDATAFRREGRDRDGLDPGGQVEPRYLRNGLLTERTQLEHVPRLGPRRRLALAMQHEEQQSPVRAVAGDRSRAIERFSALLVGVVEDEQGRAFAILHIPHGRERVGGRRACVGVADGHPPPQRLPSQLGRKTGLSDAARAGDEHDAAAPLAGVGQQRDQLGQLPIPARQYRRATIECRRQLVRAGRCIERRVLREDRLVQRAELRARLDADLLDQRAARSAEGLERLGLAAAAVQGQHQLAVQMLPKRLLGHGGLELGDQVRVSAERKLRIDPRLECRPAPLLQARDLGLHKRLIGKVGERRPAPELERLPELLCRAIRIGLELGPTARHELLEAIDIPLSGADIEPVRPPLRLEPPVSTKRLPQGRHLVVKHLLRRRAAATPPTARQPADRSRPTRSPGGSARPAGHAAGPFQSRARPHHRR